MKRLLISCALTATPWLALAHDGHGLGADAHWHATDSWGFVALAVIGAALWFSRRK